MAWPAEGVEVDLRDGRYAIRALHEGDEPVLQAFFRSHTDDTIYRRYGYMVGDMTLERARSLVAVDQSRHPALGGFGVGEQGPLTLHAVGRYFLDADGRAGECAFVTRETKRRVGLGGTLLRALIDLADARGLTSLWASVQVDNGPMLSLFRREGFRVEKAEGGDLIVRRLRGGVERRGGEVAARRRVAKAERVDGVDGGGAVRPAAEGRGGGRRRWRLGWRRSER